MGKAARRKREDRAGRASTDMRPVTPVPVPPRHTGAAFFPGPPPQLVRSAPVRTDPMMEMLAKGFAMIDAHQRAVEPYERAGRDLLAAIQAGDEDAAQAAADAAVAPYTPGEDDLDEDPRPGLSYLRSESAERLSQAWYPYNKGAAEALERDFTTGDQDLAAVTIASAVYLAADIFNFGADRRELDDFVEARRARFGVRVDGGDGDIEAGEDGTVEWALANGRTPSDVAMHLARLVAFLPDGAGETDQ